MPDLDFQIEEVEATIYSASPLLTLKLHVTNQPPDQQIHSVVLRCQIMIEATRRHYSPEEQENLIDLFGEPERWSQTLKSMLWTHANIAIPAFSENIVVDLPVNCTFDFNVAATKYFYGLQDGEIPITLLFSGTIFYQNEAGILQVSQVSWSKEARYRIPLSVWKQMMDHYYPNSAWLCLSRDAFEKLYRYKLENGIPTWEKVMEKILPASKKKEQL